MVDRIRQLLQARQLSPTQFADSIGVARPIVSHILGGRNKPSLEVVQKIIAAFPEVSMPWLLTGQGPMEATSSPAVPPAEPVAAPATGGKGRHPARGASSSAVVPRVAETLAPANTPAAAVAGAPVPPPGAARLAEPAPASLPAAMAPASANVAAADPAVALAQQLNTLSPKSIRRVLVFYSDGTFSDFSPSAEAL